jgi:hypothetical protein
MSHEQCTIVVLGLGKNRCPQKLGRRITVIYIIMLISKMVLVENRCRKKDYQKRLLIRIVVDTYVKYHQRFSDKISIKECSQPKPLLIV